MPTPTTSGEWVGGDWMGDGQYLCGRGRMSLAALESPRGPMAVQRPVLSHLRDRGAPNVVGHQLETRLPVQQFECSWRRLFARSMFTDARVANLWGVHVSASEA